MKKAITIISLLCVTIFTLLLLGGCGTEAGVTKSQTNFSVVDEQGKLIKYLTADNEEVVKLKSTVDGYLKALIQRDYKTVDGYAEYGYYTEAMLKVLKDSNDSDKTIKAYKDNKITESYESYEKLKVTFSKDLTSCKVTVIGKSKYSNVTAKFLTDSKIKKDVLLGREYTLDIVKINGVLKINGIKAGKQYII